MRSFALRKKSVLHLKCKYSIFVPDSGCEPQSRDTSDLSYKLIDTESPPYFVNSSRSLVYTTLGRTVILECRVKNLGNRAVSAPHTIPARRLTSQPFRCPGSDSRTSTFSPWVRPPTPTVSSSCQLTPGDRTNGICGWQSFRI